MHSYRVPYAAVTPTWLCRLDAQETGAKESADESHSTAPHPGSKHNCIVLIAKCKNIIDMMIAPNLHSTSSSHIGVVGGGGGGVMADVGLERTLTS